MCPVIKKAFLLLHILVDKIIAESFVVLSAGAAPATQCISKGQKVPHHEAKGDISRETILHILGHLSVEQVGAHNQRRNVRVARPKEAHELEYVVAWQGHREAQQEAEDEYAPVERSSTDHWVHLHYLLLLDE